MKLWKEAILVFMLCGALLSILLTKTMLPSGPTKLQSWATPPLASPSPSSSYPDVHRRGRVRRRVQAADVDSLLSEFSYMFQSFSEGELKQVIETLVDRRSRRDSLEDTQSKRTKRARKGANPCSLQEVVLTVSELGLGYDSDETVSFRYCSGKCNARRRNYDMVLEHMQKTDVSSENIKKGRRDRRKRDKARFSPCCRPTRYEKDMSFLGNNNIFYTIQEVSARECGCV